MDWGTTLAIRWGRGSHSELGRLYPVGYSPRLHTIAHKQKLITRVRRVRGQIEAVERALSEERGCEEVVRTIAAARGAINALAAEVICDHLDDHLGRAGGSTARKAAADELALVIRQFVR